MLSDAPLLLLDDIFSALDSTTAISLWNNVFCSSLLKGRTIVLVTQLPWIAAEGDCVVTMENGRATTEKRTVTRSPKSVTGTADREAAKHLGQAETSKEKIGSASEDESDEEVATLQARHLGRFQCKSSHAVSFEFTNHVRDGIH